MKTRFALPFRALTALLLLAADLHAADIEAALALAKQFENKVLRAQIEAHWLPEDEAFWYRAARAGGKSEYVRIDARTGARRVAPTLPELGLPAEEPVRTSALTTLLKASRDGGEETAVKFVNELDHEVELFWLDRDGKRAPYGKVAAKSERTMSTFAGHRWLVADSARTLATFEARPTEQTVLIDGPGRAPLVRKPAPDRPWSSLIKNGALTLREATTGRDIAVPNPREKAAPYGGQHTWSPDGTAFVVHQTAPVAKRRISFIEARPEGQTQPKRHELEYVKPGDELVRPQPLLVRVAPSGVAECRPIASDLFPNPFTLSDTFAIRWAPDSREFYFDYNERGHQLFRVLAVDAQTAAVRVVVEEKARTFIDYTQKTWRHWLAETGELLWMSERDGWCHLWLYDVATGAVKNQVTRGAWPVREVLHVDEKRREVWFFASGLKAGEDPVQQHLCRIKFDGTGFVQLTAGDGEHAVKFSPERRYFIDTWSRADQPPIHELRRSDDGQLVCELERADIRALTAAGWTMPERFVAKGRDGTTDIHGVLIKPAPFDPAKRYPVLEEIYAGPHGAFAPKAFGTLGRQHAYAELGFIVVKVDGMGTNHRGKAFHDVAWKNLQDAGFPDRIAWIRAAAATRPWMDLTRVGIFGGSAGGQNAMRALLDHGDFYRAAFADCGCHDNRMDKIWWNEQWLGWPVGDAYVRASNVEDAAKLRGALALCVGEIDRNVDPASTMQVAAALQKAGKKFDLFVIAGTGHGAAETPWANRQRMEFLVRELKPDAAP